MNAKRRLEKLEGAVSRHNDPAAEQGRLLIERVQAMLADDAAVDAAINWADETLNEDAPGGQLDNGRARTRRIYLPDMNGDQRRDALMAALDRRGERVGSDLTGGGEP